MRFTGTMALSVSPGQVLTNNIQYVYNNTPTTQAGPYMNTQTTLVSSPTLAVTSAGSDATLVFPNVTIGSYVALSLSVLMPFVTSNVSVGVVLPVGVGLLGATVAVGSSVVGSAVPSGAVAGLDPAATALWLNFGTISVVPNTTLASAHSIIVSKYIPHAYHADPHTHVIYIHTDIYTVIYIYISMDIHITMVFG